MGTIWRCERLRLRRQAARGWIESEWRTAESGRDARVYSLTRTGQRALAREVTVWRRYMKVYTRVLEAGPDESIA